RRSHRRAAAHRDRAARTASTRRPPTCARTRVSDTGLVRSGFAMATGTLASRISGFLRTVVIAAALGNFLADSYNVANTIPNILYDLLLGGVLSSIVIPLLVHASQRGEEEGTAYAQRLLTIVAATLAVVS